MELNSLGLRDVEQGSASRAAPAIVFLGDSFTEGYEVSFEEMFVSRLREMIPDRTLINLGFRDYGTGQSLLAFRRWSWDGPIDRVVLMFSDNDVDDSNASVRYEKLKPKFVFTEEGLELMGVPVPMVRAWREGDAPAPPPVGTLGRLLRLPLHSHLINDARFRLGNMARREEIHLTPFDRLDLTLTREILRELQRSVESRGAALTVAAIPSKIEIEHLLDWPPYQARLASLCREIGIDFLDLAPAFRRAWLRTYHRHGGRWNARGHRIAARVLLGHLGPEG